MKVTNHLKRDVIKEIFCEEFRRTVGFNVCVSVRYTPNHDIKWAVRHNKGFITVPLLFDTLDARTMRQLAHYLSRKVQYGGSIPPEVEKSVNEQLLQNREMWEGFAKVREPSEKESGIIGNSYSRLVNFGYIDKYNTDDFDIFVTDNDKYIGLASSLYKAVSVNSALMDAPNNVLDYVLYLNIRTQREKKYSRRFRDRYDGADDAERELYNMFGRVSLDEMSIPGTEIFGEKENKCLKDRGMKQ